MKVHLCRNRVHLIWCGAVLQCMLTTLKKNTKPQCNLGFRQMIKICWFSWRQHYASAMFMSSFVSDVKIEVLGTDFIHMFSYTAAISCSTAEWCRRQLAEGQNWNLSSSHGITTMASHRLTCSAFACMASGKKPTKPSELNDMLPKQKHTFVILFPLVSILVDVLPASCPRISAQRLSEAQSRGKWRMESEWRNPGLNEKRQSMFGVSRRVTKLEKKRTFQIMLSVPSMHFCLCSRVMNVMIFIQAYTRGIIEKKHNIPVKAMLKKAIALCSFITPLPVHV